MGTILAVIFIGAGVAKVLDILISGVALALHRPTSNRPIDWTPVYSRASRLRTAHPRLRPLFWLLLDVLFRAPVLVCLQSVAALIVLGAVRHSTGSAETTGTEQVLWVISAATAVLVAAGAVTYALLGSLAARGWSEVAKASGHSLTRTGDARKAIDPSLTLLSFSVALIMSFAALYLAVGHVSPTTIAFPGSAFTPIDAVYFSVITAATVGYGDFHPAAESGRLLVCGEVLMTGTVVGLLVSVLSGIAAEARK